MDGFAPATERPAAETPSPTATDWSRPQPVAATSSARNWRSFLRPLAPFLLVVALPTLLVAGYYYLVAADQFESEARFLVRTNEPAAEPASGLGQALGLGGPSASQGDARSVKDYLESHDAVAALDGRLDLRAMFRRPEADLLSRLRPADAPPETLLKFYRRHVNIAYAADSGITTLSVRAFRPADAQKMTEALLQLGEARVNSFNQRALVNSLAVAEAQLREAERDVALAQSNLTGLRQGRRDIDPERSSGAQISLAASLQEQLAVARAQLAGMSAAVSSDSPQRVALAGQVRALEAQVGAAHARMAGPAGAMAADLGAYESSKLRQEFAAKRYEAAASSLAAARERAERQQLFVVRVVEPNTPVKALFPKRHEIVAIVFFGLLLTYAIGWLILAGVREHKL